MKKNVLIVEDDRKLAIQIQDRALAAGFGTAAVVHSKEDAFTKWQAAPSFFDVVVLDISLDSFGDVCNRDGWEVLRFFREKRKDDFTVLIFTASIDEADSTMFDAVKALPIRLFTKGDSASRARFHAVLAELAGSPATVQKPYLTTHESEELRGLASSNTPVLLVGPTGSGKSVLARELAMESGCDTTRIVVVNCAGLSAELAESLLFGHVQGSFTGAIDDSCGVMMRASGYPLNSLGKQGLAALGKPLGLSTKGFPCFEQKGKVWGAIILDEIGSLDIRVQGKLLSVLEGEPIVPLGWKYEGFRPNFRTIAATNEIGVLRDRLLFREDLLRRLTTWVFECRPTYEEDVEKITHVIRSTRIERRVNGIDNGVIVPVLDEDAVQWLVNKKEELVGGLRELHWIVHRAWLFSVRDRSERIKLAHMRDAWKKSSEIASFLKIDKQPESHSDLTDIAALREELATLLEITPSSSLSQKTARGAFNRSEEKADHYQAEFRKRIEQYGEEAVSKAIGYSGLDLGGLLRRWKYNAKEKEDR